MVVSEPLAASTNLTVNLFDTISSFQAGGFGVFTYPVRPQLVRIRQPIGAFQFGILGPPGTYAVQTSTDLGEWNVLGFVTNKVGSVVFTDGTSHLSDRKFYRTVTVGL